jgi:hypothetical protein
VASIRDRHSITATITPLNIILNVKEAELTLDESKAPYAEMRLVTSLPSSNDMDLIDLTDQELRVSGEIRQDFGEIWDLGTLTEAGGNSVATITSFGGVSPSSITNRLFGSWNRINYSSQKRDFDLYITERSYNEIDKEMELKATSNESKLIFDTIVAGTSYDPASTDIATIAQKVLDRHSATISGTPATGTVAEAEATLWPPGHKAWDYLNTMLEPEGLRLWSDEQGTWYLTERQSATPGQLRVTPTNLMVSHTDSMTYDPNIWFDAVVIEYRWVDDLNVNHVAYDYAGATVPRAAYVERRDDTVYPGPGAAQGMLDRIQSRGRVIDVEAVSRYNATPGQSIVIEPPTGFNQTGFIVSVTYSLPEAEMRVTSRNLTENPVTSWLDQRLSFFSLSDWTTLGFGDVAELTAVYGNKISGITDAVKAITTGLEWEQVSVGISWETFLS